MRKTILTLLIVFSLCIFFHAVVMGQYAIKQSTFDNGAAVTSSGKYKMAVAIGQTATGSGSNSMYKSNAGYVYQAVKVTTSIEHTTDILPENYHLDQNYPNPFNPSTTIQFALPNQAHVLLTIYDMLGREVTTLVNDQIQAGVHKVQFNADGLPSGVYFYRIQANEYNCIKKTLLLK